MELDERKANIARQVALGRWGKPFGAPITTKLDEPKEWVDEATHLNDVMPTLLAARVPDIRWIFVLPVEFSNPRVTTVGVYALFVYAHLKSDTDLTHALADSHAANKSLIENEADQEQTRNAVAFYLGAVWRGVR
ncbi:MAG TPA: hypothetical protein VGQ65_25565 [Thermoanaerobaculia bacterium]|jgi:hypothetical protein|nr:hypothetical protein [Thermoanaerobaculia bacterium]